MTPEELARRSETLRKAGAALRRRPTADVLDALGRVLDAWRDPSSWVRRELEHTLPAATGFAAGTVREGLDLALAQIHGAALKTTVERELGDGVLDARGGARVAGFDLTAVLLAGAIPMPTLLGLIAPLALRSPVLGRTASRDPVTAPLVARSIQELAPELAGCIDIVSFPADDTRCLDAFLQADCVAASGSDETMTALARRVHPSRRFVARGHRVSLAVLGPEVAEDGASLKRAARGLALDVALWDQLGCLSPIAAWVVNADADCIDRVFEAIATAVEAAERSWPRGPVDAAVATAISHERAEAELRGAAGRRVSLRASRDTAWTIVREDSPTPRSSPLHRFLRVHPLNDAAELDQELRPLAPHLAAVAIAGFGTETPRVAQSLIDLGASRICEPGSLQAPPLGWPQDSLGLLRPLARFLCCEVTPSAP